jgi:Swt1-like HEPN
MLEEKIKLFSMSQQMLERDLDSVEINHNIDLGRQEIETKDDEFYPQFDSEVRTEASLMSAQYELFYCLEKSIRELMCETLRAKHGSNWWEVDKIIPDQVKIEVEKNMQRELDQAMAPRSSEEIDYTTFGQLGDMVRHRWEDFDDLFNSKKGFNRVMSSLNMLRGPIAHCSPLPPSEIVRLKSAVEDWFRLMS